MATFLVFTGTQQHCSILLYSYPTEPNHNALAAVCYAHFLSCADTVPFGFDSGRCPIADHSKIVCHCPLNSGGYFHQS